MMKNPIHIILQSDASRGIKVIALSLLCIMASAVPIMCYLMFGPSDGNPVGLGILFAVGAIIGHAGFMVGLIMLAWDVLFKKR